MRPLGIALGSALAVAACGALTACDQGPLPPVGGGDLAYPRLATYRLGAFLDEDARAMARASSLALLDVELGAVDAEGLAALAGPSRELLASVPAFSVRHDENAALHPAADARFARVPPDAWVLEPGSTTVGAVAAGDTRIRVTDPAAFGIVRPASPFHAGDEPTYLAIEGEHVRLVAIESDELVVERGVHSAAVTHPSGTRIAAHVALDPGTWLVDVSTPAWREVLADEAEAVVLAGPWAGVVLDACVDDLGTIAGGVVDLDRDGVADEPVAASAAWAAGVAALITSVRERIGADAHLVAVSRSTACAYGALDGIVLPGFPVGAVPPLPFESTLDRYQAWTGRPDHPPLSVVNATAVAQTDYAAMRLGFATALLGDGYFAFDNGAHDVAWAFDAYDGAGRGRGWLGHPQGPPTRVSGGAYVRTFTRGMVLANPTETPIQITVPPGFHKLLGTQDPAHDDGEEVSGSLVVGAHDGYLLARG
jgi:hypothetical protein